ncbi:MAG: hypothetical protein R2752_11020 [Vicinamibacterales bacterium]
MTWQPAGQTGGAARPDFSGTWTPVREAGADPNDLLAATGRDDLTITQTATTLVIQQEVGGPSPRQIRITYRLDGRDMPQTVNRAELVTHATWDGQSLVATATGPAVNWQERWSLEDGRLVIVTTSPGRNVKETRRYTKRSSSS